MELLGFSGVAVQDEEIVLTASGHRGIEIEIEDGRIGKNPVARRLPDDLDGGPVLGLWAGHRRPAAGLPHGWRACAVGRRGAGRQPLALRAALAAKADAAGDGP
jgi:hypothetical protein